MKKGVVVVFFLLIILSLVSSSAMAAITIHNVQKVSGNQSLPVDPMEVDGLVNDAENSYAWCEQEYEGKVYVGTVRNYMNEMLMGYPGGPGFGMPPGILPPLSDDRAKLYRRNKTDLSGPWELVYESPKITIASEDVTLDKGYRAMAVYSEDLYVVSYPLFTGPFSRILRFSGCSTEPDEVFRIANTSGSGLRGITVHNCRLYVGSDAANIMGMDENGIPYGSTLVNIYRSEAPIVQEPLSSDFSNINSWDGWEKAGSPDHFTEIGYFPGWSGVWDMVSFNGYLYVFIADPINGFQVFKGENPGDPGWHKVVTKSAGGKYPAGLGNYENAAASPVIFDGMMYIGTFSNWKDLIMMMLPAMGGGSTEDMLEGLVTLLSNWTPPQIYRSDGDDNWEMVIGDPGRSSPLEDFNYRTGNWRAGWYQAPSLSTLEIMDIFRSIFGPLAPLPLFQEYFPNFSIQRYIWRMCAHDGRLYASTSDLRAMFEGMAEMLGGENQELMEGLISFFRILNSNRGGFDLYFTENGTEWEAITQDGGFGEIFGYFDEANDIIGDELNIGGRSMISTSEGIFLGTANSSKGCQIWLISPDVIPDPIIPPPGPEIQDTIIEGFYPNSEGIPYRIALTPCFAVDNEKINASVVKPEEMEIRSLIKNGVEWSDNSIFFSLVPQGEGKICYITLRAFLEEDDHSWLTGERPDLWWHDGDEWVKLPLIWTKGDGGEWTCFAQIPEGAWGSMMASTLEPDILNSDTPSGDDPGSEPEPSGDGGSGGCSFARGSMIIWTMLIPMILILFRMT